jgi:hypothetical protein
MTIIIGRRGVVGDPCEACRLPQLATDIGRAADGHRQGGTNLSTAPVIDGWRIGPCSVTCLVGTVHGHPTLRGPLSANTYLWGHAPAPGWARTLSPFHRLGQRHGPEEEL